MIKKVFLILIGAGLFSGGFASAEDRQDQDLLVADQVRRPLSQARELPSGAFGPGRRSFAFSPGIGIEVVFQRFPPLPMHIPAFHPLIAPYAGQPYYIFVRAAEYSYSFQPATLRRENERNVGEQDNNRVEWQDNGLPCNGPPLNPEEEVKPWRNFAQN